VDINIQIQVTFLNLNHVQTIFACQGQPLALAAGSEGLLDIKFGLHYTLYKKDDRTYLKNKIRVQDKARDGDKAEHTRSM